MKSPVSVIVLCVDLVRRKKMKRGKDDGKTMKPMFPRLHVNDTEKGWPKAPPRNKMALYEQFSVPSSRLSPGVLPLKENNSSNPIPASSSRSNQGTGTDGNLLLPPNLSTPTATNQVRISGEATINPTLVQLEQRTQVGDEDDFMVPVFVQSGMGKSQVQNIDLREKLTSPGSKHSARSISQQTANGKAQVHFTSSSVYLRPEITNGMTASDKNRVHSAQPTTNRIENVDGLQKEADISTNHVFQDQSNVSFEKLQRSEVCLQQHSRSSEELDESEFADDVDSIRDGEVDNIPCSRGDSHAFGMNGNLNVPVGNTGNGIDRTYNSMYVGNADKSDNVSENSMIDSIPGLDICPDDVVGIIGPKHFWKARRAIINQQRVFEVQVFELHRLIKVQRLIAESPHLLLEDGVFLDNSSPGPLPAKKLRSAYTGKPHMQLKHSDDPKKPNQNVECSAENAVGKTSPLPASIGCLPSTNVPHSVNPQATPVAADNKLSSWYQTSAHHWLVPVMSPTEGLVYKPYPGHGFICGGCGPYGSIMSPSFGFPGPIHQGYGALPSTPMVGGSYFPHFGMQVMNPGMSNLPVDQLNWYPGQANQLPGDVAASNMQHQTSYDVSTHRDENHETVSQTQKFQAPKRNEMHDSTASSPANRVQGNGTDRTAQSKDVLHLFPLALPIEEEGPQPSDSDQSKRVIRVVPHNRTSATESAARIFQSIQSERKQYDSI